MSEYIVPEPASHSSAICTPELALKRGFADIDVVHDGMNHEKQLEVRLPCEVEIRRERAKTLECPGLSLSWEGVQRD